MTSRSQAKQITLGAQVASLVLAAGAVGVAGVGLPLGEQREFTPVEVSLPESGPSAAAQDPDDDVPDHRDVDFEGIVERFGMVGNAPSAAQPVTPVTDPKDPGNTQNQVANEDARYLGMVQIGARRSAMLVVDGKQRIVSQGGQTMSASGDPVRVLSVQPDHVVLAVDGERKRVDKGERQTGASTTIERTAESVRRATEAARLSTGEGSEIAANENPRADFDRRRREAIDKALDEGRITQEEAQRMLERMSTSVQRRGRGD